MWKRLLLRLLLLLVLALVAWSAIVYVWVPFANERPRRVDAIIVLAGSHSRLPVALDLFDRGVAPVLVVSNDPSDKPRTRLCRTPPAGVICVQPKPYSTRGEARLDSGLARTHGWHSLAIVSSRFHLFRVRLLFRRCTDARIELVPAPVKWWTWPLAIVSEWGKLTIAETTRRGC